MTDSLGDKVDRVRSPCVSVCALDMNDICIGCYRSGAEIATWGAMDDAGKREVLRKVALRENNSPFVFNNV